MGLTIHYKLAVARNLSVAVVRELAQRTALYAKKIGCEDVGEVIAQLKKEVRKGLFQASRTGDRRN